MAITKQFNDLFEQYLELGVQELEGLYQQCSAAKVESLYISLQTLALSAEAYGIKSYETTIARICQHLLKIDEEGLPESLYQALTYLFKRLQTIHNSLESEPESVVPRLCIYGVDEVSLSGLLNSLGSYKVTYLILKDFSEVATLSQRDILVFRLTEEELANTLYDELTNAKQLPTSQIAYLSATDNPQKRLRLAAYGVENFFRCPDNSFQVKRYFQHTLSLIVHRAKPYSILLLGESPELQTLAAAMKNVGVLLTIVAKLEEALTLENITDFDAIIVDENLALIDESTFTSALRQLVPLKQLPIFYLKDTKGLLTKLAHVVQSEKSYSLSRCENVDVLLLEILSRVREERNLNGLLTSADDAIQEMNDWKAGLDFHNIVSIADRFGRIIEVNDTFCQISGYERHELMGQNHSIVNSGYHPKSFFEEMWGTISSGNAWRGEVCNRTKKGGLYWVESSILPILNADGEIERYISIRTDITDLKSVETRLLEAQELANIGHWDAGITSDSLEWSDKIYAIFGFDKAVFRPSVEAFHAAIHPEDVKLVEASEKEAEVTGRHDVVHRIIRPDGEIRHVHELAKAFYDESGDLVRLAGTVQDVTDIVVAKQALEESEMRLDLSLQFANIGTWDYGITDGSLFWSEKISPLFGGPEQEMDTTYENFVKALHPDDRQAVLDAVTSCIENGTEYDIEHRVVWENGTIRWLHERGDVVRDQQGDALHMLGVVQDITRRKEAEDALIQATTRAEAADRAKSNFLSSMTHELRTPLNAIIGFTQLVGMNTVDENQARQVDNILQASNHLLTLINDILDLSAIESGEMSFEIDMVAIVDVVDSALVMTKNYAQQNGITLHEMDLSDWKCVNVCADFVRLKQVLINLLSNAVKYNSENGSIWVELEHRPNAVAIHVRDSGKGISAEQLEALFIPFNRLEQKNSAIEGTGIGLSICKLLTDQMGGSITVSSEEGFGSTFTVVMPLCPVGEVVDLSKDEHVVKILIISADNKALKEANQLLKQVDNTEFFAAPTARAGMAVALQNQPNIVLIDADLPGQVATELLDELKLNEGLMNIYSVLLTSDSKEKSAEQNGFDFVVTKPLTAASLEKVLEA